MNRVSLKMYEKKKKDLKTNKTDFYNNEISNNQILL